MQRTIKREATRRGGAPSGQSEYLSADERRVAGKALRERAPRAAHGDWKPQRARRDPVQLLRQSNAGRIPALIPIRFARMAQSPFSFYRGAAAIMAADLATTPASGLRVQVCGDAHLMNFGGFATPERNIFFDINDFDETLPAPWEWDVKRLAASLVIAARHLDFLDNDGAKAATDAVCAYREHMSDYASMRTLDVWYDRIDLDRVLKVLATETDVRRVKQKVRGGAQEKLAGEPLSEAGRATGLRAEDQGRSAADLSSDGKAGSRNEVRLRQCDRRLSQVPAAAPPNAVRPLPFVRPRDQGRRRWQRRHLLRCRAVHGGGRRSDLPANQGGAEVGA